MIEDYELSDKVHYIITDNASNMKKAFKVTWPDTENEVHVDDETGQTY